MLKEKSTNLDVFFDSTRIDIEKKIISTIKDEQIVRILNGGKRLRSLLSALAFKTCTGGKETQEKYQESLEGAVGIELAHGASLVHDDIIDKNLERRGKASFHAEEGIGKAILTGHKMLIQGFDIALRHGKDWARLYVDSWNEVVNGEIDEFDFNKNDKSKKISTKSQMLEAYYKIIDMKTASLFSSACKAGALGADMTGDVLEVFGDYGREIGIAYQLADDLVDLSNGETIDSVVIPLLNRLNGKTTKVGVLKKGEIKRKFADNRDKILEIYLEEIRKHVENAVELGRSNLIPSSNYKDMLIDAPKHIINKMLREISVAI